MSTALIASIMLLLLTTVEQTQRVWTRTTEKATQFQAARAAFESLTRRLSQATLNTYYRAHDTDISVSQAKLRFRRQSELQFISGPTARLLEANTSLKGKLSQPVNLAYPTHSVFFQAPLGYTEEPESQTFSSPRFRNLDGMLAGCGYLIEYGPAPDRPLFIDDIDGFPSRYRFRLTEITVPAERLTVFNRPKDDVGLNDPRVFDINSNYYVGLVDSQRKSVANWVPPLWMNVQNAFIRDEIGAKTKAYRFRYAHVRAENIIALIVLPKLPEKDRKGSSGQSDPKVLDQAPAYEFDSWRVLAGRTEVDTSRPPRTLDNTARDNQLPPIVQVTMVAVDEPSMVRLDPTETNIPNFQKSEDGKDLFKKVTKEEEYYEDIQGLEELLSNKKINYRIFTTDVVMRASKWSRDPKSP